MWSTRWVLGALLLSSTSAAAQTDRVDEFIGAQVRSQRIPGLSVAVVKDGEIIKAQGYGLADRELQLRATAETIFRIASVSKQFIATGIMLLYQDGLLGLDDPIGSYLDDAPRGWQKITIRHLLTHTSGLVREPPGFDPFESRSDREVIRSAYDLPLRFQPGEKWEYSNVGYFLLGEIIRTVSGRPWTEYLQDRVFGPTGMHATHPTNTTASLPNRAAGYTDNDKVLRVEEWTALRPSGAFLSTVLDMAKWDAVLYTDRILHDSTRRQMWTAVTLNDGRTHPYGFGWELGTVRGRRLVHHGGGGPGIATTFARFVDDGLTVILLINLDDVDVDTILNGVAAIYLAPADSSRLDEPAVALGGRAP